MSGYEWDEHHDLPYELEEQPDSKGRMSFGIVLIIMSFLLLWICPAFIPDRMPYVFLGCALICIWRPESCVFILIASTGAYFPDFGPDLIITPTRTIGLILFVRCLIHPGLAKIGLAFARMYTEAKVFFLIYFIIATSVPLVYGNYLAFFSALSNIVVVISVIILCTQFRHREQVIFPFFLGVLVASSYYILVWLGIMEPTAIALGGSSAEIIRVVAGRSDANYSGGLMSCGFAGAFFLILVAKTWKERIILLLLAIFLLLTVFDTVSRAAILASFLLALIGVMQAAKVDKGRAFVNLMLVGIVALFLSIAFAPLFYSRIANFTTRFHSESATGGRVDIWKNAVSFILSHPLPNPNAWRAVSQIHTHQTYLTWGIQGGPLLMLNMALWTMCAIVRSFSCCKFGSQKNKIWSVVQTLILVGIFLNINTIASPGHKVFWGIIAVASYQFYQKDEAAAHLNYTYTQ